MEKFEAQMLIKVGNRNPFYKQPLCLALFFCLCRAPSGIHYHIEFVSEVSDRIPAVRLSSLGYHVRQSLLLLQKEKCFERHSPRVERFV